MKKLGLVLAGLLSVVVLVTVAALTVGRVAVVSTVGNSMEPAFRAGDLALLIPARDYGVGDVVGYHSDDLDTVVMHRIVDVADDGYVLQGDNNDFLDPEHPSEDQLVGKLAVRIPRGGVWLERLTSPPALALVAFGLLAGGGAAVETRKRRRRGPVAAPEEAPARTSEMRRSDPTTVGIAVAAGVALLAGVLVGLATFRDLPGTTSDLAYAHEGTFGYTADAPRGPVYPEGSVGAGETVFLQVVDEIDVTFDWRLVPPPGHEVAVTGTGQLLLEVADGSGWRRTLPLTDPQDIEGAEATLTASVDLADIQQLVASVQQATGATGTSQTLTLTAALDVEGTVAGEAVSDELRPAVAFTLDPLRLQPPAAAEGETDPLAVSEPRTVSVPGAAGTTLDVLDRSLPVATVRIVAVALVVLSLILAGAWFLLRRREQDRTPEQDIRARHGRVVVDTLGIATAPGRTLVEIPSIDALVRLGQQLQQPVLRVPTVDGTSYVVDDGYTVYRHRLADE